MSRTAPPFVDALYEQQHGADPHDVAPPKRRRLVEARLVDVCAVAASEILDDADTVGDADTRVPTGYAIVVQAAERTVIATEHDTVGRIDLDRFADPIPVEVTHDGELPTIAGFVAGFAGVHRISNRRFHALGTR